MKTGKDGELLTTGEKVAFYDEREWRYVPFADDTIDKKSKESILLEVQPMLSGDDYSKSGYLEEKTEILHKYKLEFHANDIKYIIVSNEEEIPQMVDDIDENLPCSKEDKKKLITRIITMKQIQEDF